MWVLSDFERFTEFRGKNKDIAMARSGKWTRVRISLGHILLGLALTLLFGCLVPSVASAHAYLVRANPVPNSVVKSVPERIQLWFSEPIEPRFANVTVLGPGGQVLVSGAPAADPRDGTSFVVSLPGKSDSGTYTVHWRVVSADGHPVAGNFVFSVGASSAAGEPESETAPGPSVLAVATRGFQWVTLLILPGLIGFWRGLSRLRGRVPELPAETVRRVTGWTAAACLVTTLLRLPVETDIQGGEPLWGGAWNPAQWAVLIHNSTFGKVFVVQVPLLLLMVLAAWRREAGEKWLSSRQTGDLWLVPAFAVLVPMALAGHAQASDTPGLDLLLDMLHLGAAGWWVGGLTGMVVWLWKTRPDGEGWQAIVHFFGRGFAISLGLLVLTGTREAIVHIPTAYSLTHTLWGNTLLVKVLLVAGMATLAVWHGLPVLWKELGGRSPRRSVIAEWALGICVVACVAILTTSAPADTNPGPVHRTLIQQAGTAELWITPNRVGMNTLTVALRDRAERPLSDLETVRVTLTMLNMPGMGEMEVAVQPVGPGRYEATGSFLSMGGRWRVHIHALTRDLRDIDWTTDFPVGR